MRNSIWKFRQSAIVFEKPGFLSEKLKILTSSNYDGVQYFWLKLCTRFLLTYVHKRVFRIFFILFRSWVTCKNKKNLVSTHSFFTFLLINQALNKINKSRTSFCRHCYMETCAKFQQKILNLMVVGCFQFFKQIVWFLWNNRDMSKFWYRILYNLISITKL